MKQQVGPPPVWPTPRLRVRVPPVCNRNSDEALGDALHPFGTTLSYSSGGCRLLSWRHSPSLFLSLPHSTHPPWDSRHAKSRQAPEKWGRDTLITVIPFFLLFSHGASISFFDSRSMNDIKQDFFFCMDCFSFYKNKIVNGWNGWGKGRWGEMVHFHSCFFFSFLSLQNKIVGPFMGPIAKKGQATRTC